MERKVIVARKKDSSVVVKKEIRLKAKDTLHLFNLVVGAPVFWTVPDGPFGDGFTDRVGVISDAKRAVSHKQETRYPYSVSLSRKSRKKKSRKRKISDPVIIIET